MLEVLEFIMGILTADATLTAMVPATNMFTGPVDVVTEQQAQLLDPQINIHTASDASRSVPQVRDSIIQIDIWSRTDQLTVLNIYERVVALLNYQSGNENTAHVYWQRLGSAIDLNEAGDRRVFHRVVSYTVWSQKP